MANQTYLAKCVFLSSVRHTGRAWEARCTAAAGAETENTAQVQRSWHKWLSTLTESQPSTWQSPPVTLICREVPLLLLPPPWPNPLLSSLSVGLEKRGGRSKEAGSRQERGCNQHDGPHRFIIYFLIYLQSSQCSFFVKGITQNTYIIMFHLTNNENKEEPGFTLFKIGSLLEPQAQTHPHRPQLTVPHRLK